MGLLSERVVAVTGWGRGVGREIALLCAKEVASVVVNYLRGSAEGDGDDLSPAQQLVNDLTAAGGTALAHGASRSLDRRVGQECVSTCRSLCAPSLSNNNTTTKSR